MKMSIPFDIMLGFIYAKNYIKKRITTKKKNDFHIEMTEKEQNLFLSYVSNAEVYLEFGSGGSTMLALSSAVSKIYSVETSLEWIKYLRKRNKSIVCSEESDRLSFIYADIGAVAKWGRPTKTSDVNANEDYLEYLEQVFTSNPQLKDADVVLIDGRFRVECCQSVLSHTSEDTIIIFHDYWTRPEYHVIKEKINVIDGVDTMMVCRCQRQ